MVKWLSPKTRKASSSSRRCCLVLAAGSKHRGVGKNGRVPPALDRLLIVAEPWASLLVDGQKTWELRTRSTKVRGLIGIAAKGTGTIIGSVDLVGVHGPMTSEEMARFGAYHRVPSDSVAQYGGKRGIFAWEVAEGQRFDGPVPYRHPQGAVIWVRLDEGRGSSEA